MNRAHFYNYIKSAEFRIMFNELGWDNVRNGLYDTSIDIDDSDFDFKAIAHKSGFLVYECSVETIPQNALCRKVDMRLRRYSNDYILIFSQQDSEHHLWVTPVKTVEKRDLVTIEYTEATKAEFLFSKLDNISFGIDEQVTIVDVTARIHQAFEVNSGKITKDFYAGFKKQHNTFALFIKGIEVDGDRQWYASVMLNRLMFCYFIQKKGFLNFDVDYLRNKLEWTKQQRGENQFFNTFYKGFLCVLFHGGLNKPTHNREFEAIYGRIPYLNGGMFDEHQLEKQYDGIDIADEAFENLFGFFDKWRWHLDTRITATGKDINPDVLGYIFEQYINDRAQMGAYYTKEDITEYIGKNCIIPFLVDEVGKTSSSKDFKADGFVWQTLKSSGDKYIYNAVKKGVDLPLPDYIEQGIDASSPNLLERRARWNERTNSEFALPTEIWRETVERRERYYDINNKIEQGEITQINDFITNNLDIRQFIYDVLATTTDHLFIKHFYSALQRVTILDPTCGSGAFLFAALNILEPLYEICIDRMEEFHDKNDKLFAEELCEIENKYRSNIQHYIYKSIILRNLYGVDIMVEATEIARLRLFLKMVAVVDVDRGADNLGLDPLPDIDFNIRCGNTLVGYATKNELMNDVAFGDIFARTEFEEKIELEMQKVAMAYDIFKHIQLSQQDNIEEFKRAKDILQQRLSELNKLLNRKMYHSISACSYEDWLTTHQPFHWLAEFYQIIQGNGGFDVIIGNPPYVEYSKVRGIYQVNCIECLDSGNLYAYVIERTLNFSKIGARNGMIIQMSGFCTPRMESFQKAWFAKASFSSLAFFDDRPGKLFENIEHIRVVIPILKVGINSDIIATSNYVKFYSEYRPFLFQTLSYLKSNRTKKQFSVLKLNSATEESIEHKVWNMTRSIGFFEANSRNDNYVYYGYGYGYFGKILNYKSHFKGEKILESTGDKYYYISNDYNRDVFVSLINSTLFYWFYVNYSDGHNFTKTVISAMPFDLPNEVIQTKLVKIVMKLMIDLEEKSNLKIANYKATGIVEYREYFPKKSKAIIDEIDKVLAEHYGFTDEELDFIINYDIKYRMGSELDSDNE